MRLRVLLLWVLSTSSIALANEPEFEVQPSEVELEGFLARAQILVTRFDADVQLDHTDKASYSSEDTTIASVDAHGQITARGNGSTRIIVRSGEQVVPVEVLVSEFETEPDFLDDIRPILAKAGCAAGACHAAQHGKGGLKLSVFGFDPQADFEALVVGSRGRRVNLASPQHSLLLQKPSMQSQHVGGLRFNHQSTEYQILKRWIGEGAPGPKPQSVAPQALKVVPQKSIVKPGATQQLRVVAFYADGDERDVTALANFDPIDPGVAKVTDQGWVTAMGQGQSGVMVRFEGQAAVSTLVVPFQEHVAIDDWQSNNFMDELAVEKFRALGIAPAPLCDDATFIRRAYLDCIGTLPSKQAVLAFLESDDQQKRERLVDQLLGLTGDSSLDIYNDQYAAYWTLRWSDLIRNNSNALGEQGMWALHNWIKESFRQNKPYDEFVRQLITAKGSIYSNGPANFFRVNSNSSALTEATSQLFLGVRLECAKCHHHPFEEYSQADYYRMAAFFSRVGSKNSEEFGLFGRETVVTVRSSGEVSHPRTRARMQPTPLGGESIDHPLDRRIPLAQWLTSPDNELFAQAVVNRYMRYLLGSGLVEPVDDLRSTNPPSNVELMSALAKDFVESDYNLKHLMRTIMTSRLYGLSSQPSSQNVADQRFYSHYAVKRLTAEPLLDAIDHATGIQTKFPNLPLGTRAIELPDAEYPNYFLTTFAKPRRVSVCECERAPDANLAQALHTLNGETLASKIASKNGLVSRLVDSKLEPDAAIQEIYLQTLCRPPNQAELELGRELLAESESPLEVYQDLVWALVNSKQFLFIR